MDLIISKKNEVNLQVKAEPHVYYELADQFTFDVPGAKFMPQFRNKYWDGKIRLFNTQTGEIYVGLLDKLIRFCENHEYTYEFIDNKFYGLPFEVNKNISKEGVKDYMNYMITYEMEEYDPELDQMLFYLPVIGSTFKKVYYDDIMQRAVSKFVPADDLVVPYTATSLDDAESIIHVVKMSENELRKQQI